MTDTRPPFQPTRPRSSDFSAGAASAPRPPPRRAPRIVRLLGWLLLAFAALLIAATTALWLWAGSSQSLAFALARAAQFLPAGQQLESRDASGTLRSGGRIGWLRWSSPTLAVEVHNLALGWQLLPLLQRRLDLSQLHAARVQITPAAHAPPSAAPTPAPTDVTLPLQVGVPFQVDAIEWAGTPAAQNLRGNYRFDGQAHHLRIDKLELAQGRYTARATLQAHAPMALDASVRGAVQADVPGGSALQLGAQATLQGTLATAAAQLQLQARIAPLEQADHAMQADATATLAPWASTPLQAAHATLQAVDLAALWPQAPHTRLHGTLQAGPDHGAGWGVQAQLRNELAGPWDQGQLPLSALQAEAHYDGTRWTVPSAVASAGPGTATLQGHYTPATQALTGQAELRSLRPDLLHTALAAAPLSGRVSTQSQGDTVRFSADIQSAGKAARASPTRLHIRALKAQGSWHPAEGGRLQLDTLLLDALQARAEATGLQVDLAGPAAQGQLALTVPGATARAQGRMAPASGAGELQVQWANVEATQRWLTSLPWVGSAAHKALQGATAQGAASFAARWQGGWQTLVRQLQAAPASKSLPAAQDAFTLQATLATPQLDLTLPPAPAAGSRATALQLRDVQAELAGTLLQTRLSLDGEAHHNNQRAHLHTRVAGGLAAPGQWRVQVDALRLQAQDGQRPGPWTLELAEPVAITATTPPASARTAAALSIDAAAGQARLTGPQPGTVLLRWQPVRVATGAALQVQTQGTLQGLPLAWVDALGSAAAATAAAPPPLARMGLASTLVLDGQWSLNTQSPLRASARLQRASGDLRILAGEPLDMPTPPAVTAVRNGSQGTPAGVREAEVAVELDGDTLRAQLAWASERAGNVTATASTRLAITGNDLATLTWPASAPLAGTLRARLPDVGVWTALAPPGWRVRGTLDANASLQGTRDAPSWSGTLAADGLAVRSVVDGVDLQGGRLRAALRGHQLDITELHLQGGRGSGARIAGLSGNRSAAPQDGGTLSGTGRITWEAASPGLSGISMDLQAEAKALQVLVRADRQVSVSGQLQAQLQQGQIRLRGALTTDRATLILPDESAPRLGSDVVVRSAAKDRDDEAKAQAQAKAQASPPAAAQAHTAQPPDIAITLALGRDFALHGHGITTRLTGALDIRSSPVPGAPPRVTGEVHTDQGRYRAWGQVLDVETGLIRFNGPYDNPALDILALRPHISVRAGVQVSGSAQAPRVRLYSDPELPDAEKLSWVVLGRNPAAGGAEAAVLQQAALALLGRNGNGANATANVASRLGLDEIGFKGPGTGDDASGAALTLGKRLSTDLYVTYERSLSGALGTLYIFYDLSRRLTLRGQTGEKSAVDIIYTVSYD